MTKRTKWVIGGASAVLLVGAGWLAYGVSQVYPNAYAVWNVANLVNRHLDATDGAWPRGWDDLRRTDRAAGDSVSDEAFADYQARVDVDWSADPQRLADATAATTQPAGGDPPFRVIRLRNGKHTHWQGAEPNWLVWHHLQERRQRAATRAATSPDTGPTSRP